MLQGGRSRSGSGSGATNSLMAWLRDLHFAHTRGRFGVLIGMLARSSSRHRKVSDGVIVVLLAAGYDHAGDLGAKVGNGEGRASASHSSMGTRGLPQPRNQRVGCTNPAPRARPTTFTEQRHCLPRMDPLNFTCCSRDVSPHLFGPVTTIYGST